MRTHRRFVIGGTLLLCLSASTAHTEPIIDHLTGSAGAGGAVSYAGGSAALVGVNIPIGLVTGVDTPLDAATPGPGSDPVPEPASLLLLGSGLTAIGAAIRRRRRKVDTAGADASSR